MVRPKRFLRSFIREAESPQCRLASDPPIRAAGDYSIWGPGTNITPQNVEYGFNSYIHLSTAIYGYACPPQPLAAYRQYIDLDKTTATLVGKENDSDDKSTLDSKFSSYPLLSTVRLRLLRRSQRR